MTALSQRLAAGATWSRPQARTLNRLSLIRALQRALAEGERADFDAGLKERDLRGPLADRPGLADELVQPLLGDRAMALAIDVDAVGGAGRLPVEEHLEPR